MKQQNETAFSEGRKWDPPEKDCVYNEMIDRFLVQNIRWVTEKSWTSTWLESSTPYKSCTTSTDSSGSRIG